MKATNSIGILREVKNKWERRVAITPSEVKKLVDRNIRVLIQPCSRRVFRDIDFKAAGAIITDDLSPSSFIIGVKDIESRNLYDNHSYLNFAHVIKAQASNMAFMDECFAKNIRLFDYECIKDPQSKVRRVAFGRFAGLAGMITGMRGLGEHLLAKGCATPFLNISSCYMYSSLYDAQQQVLKIGEDILKYGIESKYGPFVFTFTGSGNVTNGALEIFKLLPHEFVDAHDLSSLQSNYSAHKVYGCVLKTQNIVEHHSNGTHFEEQHYFNYPEEYKPVFYDKIAPFTRVLVNGMYWDHRYPRLLSNNEMQLLAKEAPHAMLALFDISCDPEGALEFLKRSTNSDAPYFTYNVQMDEAVAEIDGDGVLILAVDSLPAELPLDSSQYFSATLYPYLERLASCDSDINLQKQKEYLGDEMFNAMITFGGDYTPNFKYIEALRRQKKKEVRITDDMASSEVLKIDGHLFDCGLINQILDLIESYDAEYHILELHSKVNTQQLQRASRLIVQIDCHNDQKLADLIGKLRTLCELNPKACAQLISLPFGAKIKQKETKAAVKKEGINCIANERHEAIKARKKILLFGSGFVCKAVIDYLCMSGNNRITIATNDRFGAEEIIADTTADAYCNIIECDASKDIDEELISKHDIVISLLPAKMHVAIAKCCVKYGKDLVTASYIADEMRALNDAASDARIVLLNECGLDPGLDHMSATQMIADIRNNDDDDECITGFVSLCGGLPAPECANNAFGYKFSWNPKGVLSASASDAQYLEAGSLIRICGDRLLQDGTQTLSVSLSQNPYPSMALQHVANRDSLKYISKYKLNESELCDMYRGTLRYHGFSDMFIACRILGLCDTETIIGSKKGELWSHFVRKVIENKYGLQTNQNLQEIIVTILGQNGIESDKIDAFLYCLHNDLNLFSENECLESEDLIVCDAFCELLADKLQFNLTDDRDMVLMMNRISTNKNLIYESSLLVFGDESYSAMARTVGFPVAIATQFLLNDELDKRYAQNIGVIDATNAAISQMVLEKAKDFGIEFKKRIISV